MNIKKVVSIVLCVLIGLFSFSQFAFAAEKRNDYPIVMVHGLMGWGEADGVNSVIPYWGTLCGNIPQYLRSQGYEVYTATTGGQSSVWDQTCELYAQLTGTRVDYGEAHSQEHGHSRYGRTYKEPLCPSFGKDKIHLYGYSLGGAIARLLASLLEYGSPEEFASCDNPSELFKGGKGHYIFSVTTASAPHGGTLILDRNGSFLINALIEFIYVFWGLIGNSPLRSFWDIQFEQ
ncbi:MAG: lipase, partial [Clostridia bacterium]|nr:lipase [Clostridia bacterium]